MKKTILALFLVLFSGLVQTSFATDRFTYGITFTDDQGAPLALTRSLHTVTIKLWPDSVGGTNPAYQETFLNAEVKDGLVILSVGVNGFPAGGLPDLEANPYVEVSIRIEAVDSLLTLSPRTRLPSIPLARNAHQASLLGPHSSDSLVALINAGDHARYTDIEAANAAYADSRMLTIDQTSTLSANLTLSNSTVLILSAPAGAATTRLAIRAPGIDLLRLDSLGIVMAQTFVGDGSLLGDVLHLSDTQTISGTKTFSALNTQFDFQVSAGVFSGDGSLITSVVHDFGDETIEGEKTFSKALHLHSHVLFEGSDSQLGFLPSTTPTDPSSARIKIQDAQGSDLFSVDASGNLTGQNLTAVRFYGDGSSLTNLVILTGYLNPQVVTESKIQDDAVTSGKIFDSTIVSGDIQDGAIQSSNIASGAVTSGKISGALDLAEPLTFRKSISHDLTNQLQGDQSHTHINLGMESITGSATATASYISIAGGFQNTATADYSFIGGGKSNLVTASYAGVVAGANNRAEANYSFIGGGDSNQVQGNYGAVLGGKDNQVSGNYSSIMGGRNLILQGDSSLGFNASATTQTINQSSVIVFWGTRMGLNTTTPSARLEILGDSSNPPLLVSTGESPGQEVMMITSEGRIGIHTTNPAHALDVKGTLRLDRIILGSDSRTAFGVTTGAFKIVSTTSLGQVAYYLGGAVGIGTTRPLATLSVLGSLSRDDSVPLLGALSHTHVNLGIGSTSGDLSEPSTHISIGGGYQNTAVANYTKIGGGIANLSLTTGAFIGGGGWNTAWGSFAMVGAGKSNLASGIYASVGGGAWNTAQAEHSRVGGGLGNSAWSTATVVAGGASNSALGEYSSISGGRDNLASGPYNALGAGRGNLASGAYNSVAGGRWNTGLGDYTVIGGGLQNSAALTGAFVGGGVLNTASGIYSMVGGGDQNQAGGSWSSIGGGKSNQANGNYTVIPGGRNLSLLGDWSFGFNASTTSYSVNLSSVAVFQGVSMGIGTTNPQALLHVDGSILARDLLGSGNLSFDGSVNRDAGNQILGDQAETHVNLGVSSTTGLTSITLSYISIGGGYQNTASGDGAVIGGGMQNQSLATGTWLGGGVANFASGTYASLAGGRANTASGDYSSLGGGYWNTGVGNYSFIGGGFQNKVNAAYGTIGGGESNLVKANYATISGGKSNIATHSYSTVGGGDQNQAEGDGATVSGGRNNATNGTSATISGGSGNAAKDHYTVVGGGNFNQILTGVGASYATISGGTTNTAGAAFVTVGGGGFNKGSGAYVSIAGGGYNTAVGSYASIAGGEHNTAAGNYSAISGGDHNIADGAYSSVGGGQENSATASWAVIGGGGYHRISGNWSTISGGANHWITGTYSTVAGGQFATITANWSTASGGKNNAVGGDYGVVSGGSMNQADGDYSAVVGGNNLIISGDYSLGFNGSNSQSYTISESHVAALMGVRLGINTTSPAELLAIQGDGSTRLLSIETSPASTPALIMVTSGWVGLNTTNPTVRLDVEGNIRALNFLGNASSLVFSSQQNFESVSISAKLSVGDSISADFSNQLLGSNNNTHLNLGKDSITGSSGGSEQYVSVLGGRYNTATADYAVVAGGSNNKASASHVGVFAGTGNIAEDPHAVVVGGFNNTASGDQAGILAGDNNTVNGSRSVVLGGRNLTISGNNSLGFNADSSSRTISGNQIVAFLGGVQVGINDETPGEALEVAGNVKATSFIGDASSLSYPATLNLSSVELSANLSVTGYINRDPGNTLSTNTGTHVNLGDNSTTNNTNPTVGGGEGNSATANYTVVAGGQNNTASGTWATVGGGSGNTASNSYATVGGGLNNTVSGNRSVIPGGQNLSLQGLDSFGFNGSGTPVTVSEDNVAVFLSVKMGVGTTNPKSQLQVSQGGLCVETDGACNGNNTAGTIYANTTSINGVDYAEYFPSEGPLKSGDLAGLHRASGKVRRYREGDQLIGVVSTKPGIIGGHSRKGKGFSLIAILGQVPVDDKQIQVQNGVATTKDGLQVGYKLSTGDIYLDPSSKQNPGNLGARLQTFKELLRIQRLKTRVLQTRLKALQEELKEAREIQNERLDELEESLKAIKFPEEGGD